MTVSRPTALFFDVFGTTVDWRSSIVLDLEAFGLFEGLNAPWERFADRWRAGFRELQSAIVRGERNWLSMDNIHREVLERLVADYGGYGIADDVIDDLNRAWHRLSPWSDVVNGLTELKRTCVISTLSNGNMRLLVDLAKFEHLPWDCVLSTEMFGTYKPDPEVYLGAARMLEVEPSEAMMVAAHAYDLDGAAAAGLQTAYVFRPDEFGPGVGEDPGDTSRFDVVVDGFEELAERLLGDMI